MLKLYIARRRKPCYRKDDRAPHIWMPWKFSGVPGYSLLHCYFFRNC